jgi:ubiquinone biosynthesis protein COQ9
LANKITVTYLNVCGLKSKLLIPEFLDLIKLYDIIFFCETKLDSYDLPEGYSFATKIRKKFASPNKTFLFTLEIKSVNSTH